MLSYVAESSYVTGIFYCFILINAVDSDEILKTIEIKETDNPIRSIMNITKLIIDQRKLSPSDKITIHTLIPGGMDPFYIKNQQLLSVKSKIDREAICGSGVERQPLSSCPVTQCCVYFGVNARINEKGNIFFVLIKILDVNDNIPRFETHKISGQPYGEVSENAERGKLIALPIAHDADSEQFSIKSYEVKRPFTKGKGADFAYISLRGAPYLKVVGKLDYETCKLYEFTLVAYDYVRSSGAPRRLQRFRKGGRVQVQIAVLDENDNAPQLEIVNKLQQIYENKEYIDVVEFRTRDKDSGDNGKVTVTLEGEKSLVSRFQVIQQTPQSNGFVRLNSRFDREKSKDSIKFIMVARDHGVKTSLSMSQTIRIKILNANDNPPRIQLIKDGQLIENALVVKEDTQINTEIVYVHVTDADSDPDMIECSLENFKTQFSLEPQPPSSILRQKRYHLKLIRQLDHERQNGPIMRLEIRCDDKEPRNSLSSTVRLRIRIGDVNDNAPQFTQILYSGRVAENKVAAPVTFIQPIRVLDRDTSQNGKFVFSLHSSSSGVNGSSSSTDLELFHCEESTGRIATKDALDYEARQQYHFIIVATDQAIPPSTRLSSSATVIINVVDANDNMPSFSKGHYTFSIREDARVGSVIGKVTATDKDSAKGNKVIQYRFGFGNMQFGMMQFGNRDLDRNMRSVKRYVKDHVHLNKDTGELTTRKSLDYEKFSSVTFQIVATNPQPFFYGSRNHDNTAINYLSTNSEVSVIIKMLNVNDNKPEFKLIEGKKSHLEFVYNDQANNCEKIPYEVIDNDVLADHNKATGCCEISIENDYNGLFSLMSSDHPIYLCLSRKPSRQQSYTLTVVAKDRIIQDDDRTFQSKITFPVVISEYHKPPLLVPGGNKDNRFPKENDNRYSGSGSNGYSNNGYSGGDKGRQNKGDIKNIIIVGILVAVVVAFLIIVVVIIFIIRRCSYVHDPDYDNPKSNATGASMSVDNHDKHINYQDRSATILSHRSPQPMGNTGMMSSVNQSHNTLNSSLNMIPQLYPALQSGPPRSTQLFYNPQTSPSQAAHYQMLNPYQTNVDYTPPHQLLHLDQQRNTGTLLNPTHKSISNLSDQTSHQHIDPHNQHTYQEPLLQHNNDLPDNNDADYLSKTTSHTQALLVQNPNVMDTPNTTKRNYVQTTFV